MASAQIVQQGKALYAYTGSEWIPLNSGVGFTNIVRWHKTAVGGETTLSGNDDNNLALFYTPGLEQVYLNGNLLVRGSDYTASTGTSITGLSALAADDVISIYAFGSFNVENSVTLSSYTAKGTVVAGTGASTVGSLAVGTNDYYLKANSATATGLEWAALTVPPADNDQPILASQIFG